jgi:orotate phosphoribosyltransferase
MTPRSLRDMTLVSSETLAVVRSAVRREPLTTEDGRTLTDYVDGHSILGDPTGLAGCCALATDEVVSRGADAVVGEVSAACGLVAGVVLCARDRGVALQGRFLRKEPKSYGLSDVLTSELRPPRRIVVLDDVSGVGNSAVRVVTELQRRGHQVLAMVVIVDRDEGATARLARLGVDLVSLFSRDEVVAAPAISVEGSDGA